tara:strand:- start:53 stop:889 length:837 start_codon:yes stop_codon:yes gene_type:complete
MIIWISSYPKSGNTYLRSFLSAYYFSKKGKFEFDQLVNILQFPSIKFSKKDYFNFSDAASNWINNQKTYFENKKFVMLKTHNTLKNFKGQKFTSCNETLGAIYIVRDPRNLISSMCHHYSFTQQESYLNLINKNASLSEKSVNGDCSNFTFLGSWADHYKSWRDTQEFKVLFIKYEDLQYNKEEIFRKIILFIENLKQNKSEIDEVKFINSIKSTNFANLKNKELNEKFEESVYSKDGKKKNFFNLGFKNNWKNFLKKDILELLNKSFKQELIDLNYY